VENKVKRIPRSTEEGSCVFGIVGKVKGDRLFCDKIISGQENQQLKKQLPQGIEKSERFNEVRNRCR
jgi:hypothetical protein